MFTRFTEIINRSPHIIIYIASIASLFCIFFTRTALAVPYASSGQIDYWQLPIPAQDPPAKKLPDILINLDASNCGICHPKQYREWQTSFHASAVCDGLLGQLYAFDQETHKECLRCHAP